MTLIAENQEVKIYQHNTVSGLIIVYQFKNGELSFGADKASTLNRLRKHKFIKLFVEY